MNKTKEQNQQDAHCIHALGWRQGSIFNPTETPLQLPSDFVFDKNNELLIIASQSCSVVAFDFNDYPLVETMVAKTLKDFNPKSHEANGKNQRKIHLKLSSPEYYSAVECDINRRFFFKRRYLLEFSPSKIFLLHDQRAKNLAAWLGRSYTRIALPHDLVNRMKKSLLPAIEKVLKIKSNTGCSFYENIHSIHLKWEPHDDKTLPETYKLWLFFLCKSNPEGDSDSDELGFYLHETVDAFMQPGGKEGIELIDLKCQPDSETYFNELNSYDRFSEWDYFTSLTELIPILNSKIDSQLVAC